MIFLLRNYHKEELNQLSTTLMKKSNLTRIPSLPHGPPNYHTLSSPQHYPYF